MAEHVLLIVLAVLANYRASRMAAVEDGPFDIFSRLQERVGGSKNWIGRGLACPLCISFWLAIPFTLLVGVADWRQFVLLWFGLAGATVVLHRVVG